MSFNINGPNPKPMIQSAQNMMNNGGGGNLGYFKRGNKKKDDENIDDEISDFFIKEAGNDNKDGDLEKEEGFLNKLKNKIMESLGQQSSQETKETDS